MLWSISHKIASISLFSLDAILDCNREFHRRSVTCRGSIGHLLSLGVTRGRFRGRSSAITLRGRAGRIYNVLGQISPLRRTTCDGSLARSLARECAPRGLKETFHSRPHANLSPGVTLFPLLLSSFRNNLLAARNERGGRSCPTRDKKERQGGWQRGGETLNRCNSFSWAPAEPSSPAPGPLPSILITFSSPFEPRANSVLVFLPFPASATALPFLRARDFFRRLRN